MLSEAPPGSPGPTSEVSPGHEHPCRAVQSASSQLLLIRSSLCLLFCFCSHRQPEAGQEEAEGSVVPVSCKLPLGFPAEVPVRQRR